jgi:sulfide:quinone oxidoreductase
MKPFSVVIAGGGVAALEGLLRLHRLAGAAVAITLLAPDDHFTYRALSVNEPFSLGIPERHPLESIVRDTDAEWVRDSLTSVDAEAGIVHTKGVRTIHYDALFIAVGTKLRPAFEHIRTFWDHDADEVFRGVVQDVEAGYVKSAVFISPPGPTWQLPLYELALMTAERAGDSNADVELSLVTADAEPLPAFGGPVSAGVRAILEEAGVRLFTSSEVDVEAKKKLVVRPGGTILHPDSTVALPHMSGPGISGVPGGGENGFIPIHSDCSVPGTRGRIFAAGDCTDSPLKHGGVGAQHADIAAAAIARLAGIDVELPSSDVVLRGKLLTGGRPKYLWARSVADEGFDSVIADEPIEGGDEKVTAAELVPYLEPAGAPA